MTLEELEARFAEREPEVRAFLPEEGRFERLRRERDDLARRWPDPARRPPLFGVPVGVKDIFHVDGFETRAGSRLPPEVLRGEEAASVTALRAAGALILGKTVSTEFAYFAPGPTRNPWNPEHTPGGSSSGSAAAVGAGLCPLALGSQTIGSILRPAAFCGAVGFKPSYERVSRAGVIPLAPSFDHMGTFTPDVAGAERAAAVLCKDWRGSGPGGRDESRPYTGLGGPAPSNGRFDAGRSDRHPGFDTGRSDRDSRFDAGRSDLPSGLAAGVGARFIAPAALRLGIPEGPYLERAAGEGLAHFRETCRRLAAAGYEIVSIPALADFDDVHARHLRIFAAEAARVHREWFSRFRDLYDPRTAELIERGQAVADDQLARELSCRGELRQALTAQMDRHGLDLWISPPALGAAPRGLDSTGDPVMNVPWTQAGMPAVSLPAGRNAAGLPMGLQVAARFGKDEELLAAARGLEEALRS